MLHARFSLLATPLFAAGLLCLSGNAEAQQYPPAPPQYPQAPPQYQPAPPQYQQPPPQYPQAPQQQYQPYPQQAPTVVIQQQYPPPAYQQQPIYVQQAPQPQVPQGPRILKDWDPDQPIPPGYHQEEHTRKGLVIGGAVMFGSMYLITALSASIANDAGGPGYSASWLYVPAIGPLFQMGQNGSNGTSATGTVDFLCVLDSLVQIGGITMFAVGLTHPNTEIVRNDFGFSLHLQPMIGPNRQGIGLGGTF